MLKNNKDQAKRKGQSTVEYIVLVTAVIAVVILFLTGPASPFRAKVNQTMDDVTEQMVNMSDRIIRSAAPAP